MTSTINRNLLSPNKFKIVIEKFPEVEFFTQRFPLPSVSIGKVQLYTNQNNDIPFPGDKLQYDDMVINLLMDEDMKAYQKIYDWMNTITEKDRATKAEMFSDITVYSLTNQSNKNRTLLFRNCFPWSLGAPQMDVSASEDQPVTFDVTFTYNDFLFKDGGSE